jgi:hypothetical protein
MDDQLQFVKLIAERLASADLDYMLTGSMAMAVYVTPRMTRDVDVVLECGEGDVDTIVSLFAGDCYVEREAVADAIATRGMFNVIHNEWIIKGDFVVRKDDEYHRAEFDRRRTVDAGGVSLSVVAPEDLVLSKLVWARETDSELQRRDVQELLAADVSLDREYLDAWAEKLGVGQLLRELEA